MIVESKFTKPRPFCPNPEHWHSPDINATEAEITLLIGAMIRATQPDIVIETGTYLGHTAEAIGRALSTNGHGHLYTLEVDPVLAQKARVRCEGLPVTVIRGSSLEYVPGGPVDFAWFDSDISIRGQEFRRFYRWMHPRTVVGFHDYGPQHPSVKADVDSLLREKLITTPLTIHSPRGACFANII